MRSLFKIQNTFTKDSSRHFQYSIISHFSSSDIKTKQKWLHLGSAVYNKGRVFEPDVDLLPASTAMNFPSVDVVTLNKASLKFPSGYESKAKLIAFSVTGSGFNFVKSWTTPYRDAFASESIDNVVTLEICFVDYVLLRWVKNILITTLQKEIPTEFHDRTGLAFGGVRDFAVAVGATNKYTGYVYLLDSQNRIRWRASGGSEPSDMETLLRCTKLLIQEIDSGTSDTSS